MTFIIVKQGRREYVTPPESIKAYTTTRHLAHRYPTREAAERDCCGNERIEEA